MTAVDDAEPGRVATVDVTIVVIRNANAPKFVENQYQKTVSQETPLGEAIIVVNATDKDGVGIWLLQGSYVAFLVARDS